MNKFFFTMFAMFLCMVFLFYYTIRKCESLSGSVESVSAESRVIDLGEIHITIQQEDIHD